MKKLQKYVCKEFEVEREELDIPGNNNLPDMTPPASTSPTCFQERSRTAVRWSDLLSFISISFLSMQDFCDNQELHIQAQSCFQHDSKQQMGIVLIAYDGIF